MARTISTQCELFNFFACQKVVSLFILNFSDALKSTHLEVILLICAYRICVTTGLIKLFAPVVWPM